MKAKRFTEQQIIGVLKEAENSKLKRPLAEAELDKSALKSLLGRKW
jgi:hypothetical protein